MLKVISICKAFASLVGFQWKKFHFALKNSDLLIRNLDFLLKNVDFIIQQRDECLVSVSKISAQEVTLMVSDLEPGLYSLLVLHDSPEQPVELLLTTSFSAEVTLHSTGSSSSAVGGGGGVAASKTMAWLELEWPIARCFRGEVSVAPESGMSQGMGPDALFAYPQILLEGDEVSFQWKNPDLLIKNPDFLLKNVDFIIKKSQPVRSALSKSSLWCPAQTLKCSSGSQWSLIRSGRSRCCSGCAIQIRGCGVVMTHIERHPSRHSRHPRRLCTMQLSILSFSSRRFMRVEERSS